VKPFRLVGFRLSVRTGGRDFHDGLGIDWGVRKNVNPVGEPLALFMACGRALGALRFFISGVAGPLINFLIFQLKLKKTFASHHRRRVPFSESRIIVSVCFLLHVSGFVSF